MPIKDCFSILLKEEKIIQLAQDEIHGGLEAVLGLIEAENAGSSKLDGFHDALLDFLSENGQYITDVKLECLSSYSETTTFSLRQFGGVFWVENLEFGDTGYFLTAEDAMAAVGEEHGFDWKKS